MVAGVTAMLLGAAGAGVFAWQRDSAPELASSPLGSPAICVRYGGLPDGFGQNVHAGMVRLPGGSFEPGVLGGYPDERPAGTVTLPPFWIDRTEVTNAQFAAFVEATGYRTLAEREGAAAVFRAPERGAAPPAPMSWWSYVDGADWRHPDGPGSSVLGLDHHPVVHIAQEDALAYAKWLGRDLPTEDEWEWAARAHGQGEPLEREPRDADGKPLANFWQGVFPVVNIAEDGHAGRAPVGCYPGNGWGLHDMVGNVWEWTITPYRGPRQQRPDEDPRAGIQARGKALPPGTSYVIKGGSFLCAANYCARYRTTSRQPMEDNLPTSHVGFRTVLR